jgi:hypothetical protein
MLTRVILNNYCKIVLSGFVGTVQNTAVQMNVFVIGIVIKNWVQLQGIFILVNIRIQLIILEFLQNLP